MIHPPLSKSSSSQGKEKTIHVEIDLLDSEPRSTIHRFRLQMLHFIGHTYRLHSGLVMSGCVDKSTALVAISGVLMLAGNKGKLTASREPGFRMVTRQQDYRFPLIETLEWKRKDDNLCTVIS